MKKNTLFVSVLAGLGSMLAVFAVLNTTNEAQYSPREVANKSAESKANSEFFSVMRRNLNTGKVEASDYIKAVAASKFAKKSRVAGLDWEFAGPDNIGGRARAIVVDNVNPDVVYAGGAGGGMYVSTNAAGTWEYKSSDWDNLNVSTIAQDGNGRVYAGTGMYADAGSAVGSAFPGGGIWVSDDRGVTWSHLASTTPVTVGGSDDWSFVNRVAVSKVKNSDGNYTVYAATRRGLMVSKDKGATWFEPMTLPSNCNNKLTVNVQEVVVTSTNRVLVSGNGSLYVSNDGEAVCSYLPVGAANGIGGSTRMSLSVCAADENVVYAFQSFGGSPATFSILNSTDGGDNWNPLSPAPPTTVIDSTFDLMGSNPAAYNQAITVDPTDCDRIYVGAVELYRVNGSWSSVAVNFGPDGIYVHSDKHWFEFSPHAPETMYVGSDGGVGKTENAADNFVSWTTNNRHFGTTQYYGIAFSKNGEIIGGTQDNGTHYIDPSRPGVSSKDGTEILGGDGFDCEVSNIGNVAFGTLYYGEINRLIYGAGFGSSRIHPQYEGSSPFNTVIRLWESTNDLTSQDTILFANDTISYSVGSGDGIKKLFTGTVTKPQDAAKLIAGSFKFVDVAGSQTATDSDANGVLKSFGDSVGTIDYVSGEYSVRWSFSPPVGSAVNSVFAVNYNAGDTLNLVSQNMAVPFDYVLPANLGVNDSIKSQDPVQTLLAVSMYGGIRISREALYFPLGGPLFTSYDLNGWGGNFPPAPTSMEFSEDGNSLYIGGTNGNVVRVSGLNNWYSSIDPLTVLTQTTIFSGNAAVSGLCMHPTDPGKLLVSVAGYGSTSHIWEITNADVATGNAVRTDINGDLPNFPVYDAEYNVNNTNQVLLGTELGLWASDDVSAGSVEWTDQSGAMGKVPVLDVRQQRLPHNEAANYGMFYLGTFGRGIWSSGDLVSVNEPWADYSDGLSVESLEMYPNPVSATATLSFDMNVAGSARVMIYDISGKLMSNEVRQFAAGKVKYSVDSYDMPAGTYFATVTAGDVQGQTKFVVVK